MEMRPIYLHLDSSFGNQSILWKKDRSLSHVGLWGDSLELLGVMVICLLSRYGPNQTVNGRMGDK